MTDYSTWSLKQLKAAAAQTQPAVVKESAQYFSDGATAMTKSQDDYMRTLNSLQSAWQGKAAQAAISSAQSSYAQMELTRASATDAQTSSNQYQGKLEADKRQAASIQDVDTSWGHAAKSGWFGGLAGIGVAKYEQQQKYNAHRDAAAKVVQQMDEDGQTQAATMSTMTWPSGGTSSEAPVRNLPPVPSSAGKGGSGGGLNGNYNYAPPGAVGRGPGYTPVMPGPTAVHHPNPTAPHGPKTTRPPEHGTPPPPIGSSPAPNLPTAPQGGDGPPVTPTGAPGGSTAEQPPTVSGTPGAGAAAAGGLLGGAGLLGAGGALGGRAAGGRLGGLAGEADELGARGLRGGAGSGGTGEGEGTGLRGRLGAGGAAGEGEGTGLRGRLGSGGLAEGEGTGLRGSGSGGLADGEGTGLRGGARGPGGAPDEGLDPARRGSLRSGAPEGFGGEPVAAEAGRMGGYPMGAGGARRGGGDDEEAPMPDYLVETDDVWGDGKSAAPPVIGE